MIDHAKAIKEVFVIARNNADLIMDEFARERYLTQEITKRVGDMLTSQEKRMADLVKVAWAADALYGSIKPIPGGAWAIGKVELNLLSELLLNLSPGLLHDSSKGRKCPHCGSTDLTIDGDGCCVCKKDIDVRTSDIKRQEGE